MMTNEPSIPNADEHASDVLELLTEEDETWTAVPGRSHDDESEGQWISVPADSLCDLEDWR